MSVYNNVAMVYVDPSAWKNVEELAFCLSYHCLDTVYEG